MEGIKVYTSTTIRNYFSTSHLRGAAIFASKAKLLETEFNGDWSTAAHSEHRAFVTASVLMSASFMEANINEFFADSLDNAEVVAGKLETADIELLGESWDSWIQTKNFSILDKFQIALNLLRKNQFEKGKEPYQNANLVITLRNALIHHVPQNITISSSIASQPVTPHKIQQQLENKFELNPLYPSGNPFFADKCLSNGCCVWALKASLNFVDDFYLRLNINSPYENVREEIIALIA